MRRRRATAPLRRFTASSLAALERDIRRQLCQSLIVESGVRLANVDSRGDSDDFIVESVPVWRVRRGYVRVVYRSITDTDVEDLAAVARDRGLSDAVLIEAAESGARVPASDRIQVVRGDELVARLQESALVAWHEDQPQLDRDHYALIRGFERLRPSLDALGLRWLSSLARNKLPPGLAHRPEAPERLFERIAFRIFTTVFRFGGWRLGEREVASRAPDAILVTPPGAPMAFSALLDCKAARDGYTMNADDERALTEYIETYRTEAESSGAPLRYVVVLSSSFPGAGKRHGYYGRARKLADKGVTLVYLRAADLVRLAIAVEQADTQPAERERIDWRGIFEHGIVPREALSEAATALQAS